MAVPRSPRVTRVAAGAIRVALVLAISLAGIASNVSAAAAQQGLFETGLDVYRRQLGEFHARAAALITKIREVPVVRVYCDSSDWRADGRALAELRLQLGDLERDWTVFKRNIASTVEVSGPGSQFMRAGVDPMAPGFWVKDDQDVLQGPRKALDAAFAIHKESKVVECKDRTPKRRTTPLPPPTKDPLAGLTRPPTLRQAVPPAPPPFCSNEALEAWRRSVIDPLLAENQKAATALRDYHDAILDRLLPALRAGERDSVEISKLRTEETWERAEHDTLTKRYYEILDVSAHATVIDCTEHFTTPQPVAPVDTTHPRTQEKPGTGTPPVDTTHPHTQEKPGTGAPTGTEPRVGALPGGRNPIGELRIGAGFDENWYHDFAHTAGDEQGITAFDGKQITSGWGADVGLRYGAWQARVCRHVNRLHLTQYYGNPGAPYARLDGDLDGSFYDVDVGRRLSFVWNTYVEVYVGATFAYDVLEFRSLLPSGAMIDQPSRSLKTWKTNFGMALERPLTRDFGVRLGSTYTTAGKSGDADANLRVSAGMTYRLPIHLSY